MSVKTALERALRSERRLRGAHLRSRTFPQAAFDHGLRGIADSTGDVVQIRTSERLKTLRQQGIHILIQRSRRVRSRSSIFDYFHRLNKIAGWALPHSRGWQ